MLMKTSFVCLLLILYMGIFYFSKKHLPIRATTVFKCYYFDSVIVIIFDLITLYTVNHMDTVPESVNYIAHVIYILSINVMVYLYFRYVRSLLENKLQISKTMKYIQVLPMIATSVLIVFLPLGYIHGAETNYSMGAKVYALYANIILGNIGILYYSIRYRKLLSKEKMAAIIVSVPVMVVVTIINIALPEALFTIVYVILTAVGLMMSNENMEKYIDTQTGMFNQYAFGIVMNESCCQKKSLYCTLITMSESENVHMAIDWKMYIDQMKQIQRYCKKALKCSLYRVSDNGFVLLSHSGQTADRMEEAILSYATKNCVDSVDFSGKTMYITDMSSDEVMSGLAQLCIDAINKMAIYDYLTGVYNRNYFEKKLQTLEKEESKPYYLIADLNNLKETNDVFGHSAGDELLQATAQLLRETVGKEGTVYRQGGDEFAVLWEQEDVQSLLSAVESARKEWNKNRVVPISFAIGYCRISEEDWLNTADDMMYRNKREMKKQSGMRE